MFIFTDNDIRDDQFLEYLNNVLSSGEVALIGGRSVVRQHFLCSGLGFDHTGGDGRDALGALGENEEGIPETVDDQ